MENNELILLDNIAYFDQLYAEYSKNPNQDYFNEKYGVLVYNI